MGHNLLRGLVDGTLKVSVLTEGVHSGDAGGVVPSSFRMARQLLDRLDDSRTGVVKPPQFNCDIPAERVEQARPQPRFSAKPCGSASRGTVVVTMAANSPSCSR